MEYELELEPLVEPEQQPEYDENLVYYGTAIGYRNTEYYLDIFKRFEDKGPGLSWHWPAFFVTFFWLLYRKMWGVAFLYFVMPLAFAVVASVLASVSTTALIVGYALLAFVVLAAFPLLANAMYYQHIRKQVALVKRTVAEKEVRLRMLAADGGTSGVLPFVTVASIVFAIIGVVATSAIPAYQGYLAQDRVFDAVSLGIEYEQLVEEYVRKNRQWPRYKSDLANAGRVTTPGIDSVTVKNGAIFIYFGGARPLNGTSLAFLPSLSGEKEIIWECLGIDIDESYLPQGCRF